MNILKTTSVALALLALSACAGVPPPRPLDSQSAAIGISVSLKAPIRLFSSAPDRIYFVKVEREEDLYTQGQQYTLSNYVEGDHVYLLNAPPGRYVAVAAARKQPVQRMSGGTLMATGEEHEYTTFFSKEIIKLTEVTAAPGTIVFMGKYVVNTSAGLTDADDAQLHYFHLVAPNALIGPGVAAGVLSAMFSGEFFYRGMLAEGTRDKQAEDQFLGKAIEDLREGAWSAMIQQRLDFLKASH